MTIEAEIRMMLFLALRIEEGQEPMEVCSFQKMEKARHESFHSGHIRKVALWTLGF
jgi:hypothetical protein